MLMLITAVAIYMFYVLVARAMGLTVVSFCKGAAVCVSSSIKETNRISGGNKFINIVVNNIIVGIIALKAFVSYSVGIFFGLVSDVNDGLKNLDEDGVKEVRMIVHAAYFIGIVAAVCVFFTSFGGFIERLITFATLIRFTVGVKRMKRELDE